MGGWDGRIGRRVGLPCNVLAGVMDLEDCDLTTNSTDHNEGSQSEHNHQENFEDISMEKYRRRKYLTSVLPTHAQVFQHESRRNSKHQIRNALPSSVEDTESEHLEALWITASWSILAWYAEERDGLQFVSQQSADRSS